MTDGQWKAGVVGYALFLAACLTFGGWAWIYSYHDCMKVGHTKLYCILNH